MRGGEQLPTSVHETGAEPMIEEVRLLWADHDVLPDDPGAWLYVADVRTLDGDGPVHGAWVPAHLDDRTAAQAVGSVLGESIARWHLAVIDQVGLGDEMVDEDHFVPEDHR